MSKQLWAKIGVFALIVVNLGAYYVFWPDSGNNGKSGDSWSSDKSGNQVKPVQFASNANAGQPGESAKPSLLHGEIAADKTSSPMMPDKQPPMPDPPPAIPLPLPGIDKVPPPLGIAIPAVPAPITPIVPDVTPVQAKSEDPTIEQLKRLKASFNKEEYKGAPPPIPEPLSIPGKDKKELAAPTTVVENSAPKTVRGENSPWTFQMEIAAGHKVLTARLNKRIEFRILCEQVEMKTLDGAVLAIGKVTFTAPYLKGSCNRLVIGLGGESLVLDGQAELQIQQAASAEFGNPTAELKGEHLTLRLQPPPAALSPAQLFPNPNPNPGTTQQPTSFPVNPFAKFPH